MSDALTLTPVTQTRFGGDHGDCFAACVATITGVPLDQIPNFIEAGREWFAVLWNWADETGWDVYSAHSKETLPNGPLIVTGPGARGFGHACVWIGGPDGMIAWDPHPSRAGLVECDHWIVLERDGDGDGGEDV